MQVCRNQCTVHTSVCFLRWREIGELTQHKVKERPFAEGSIDCYICARALIFKTRNNFVNGSNKAYELCKLYPTSCKPHA